MTILIIKGKKQIEIPDGMMQEIEEVVADEYFFYDGLGDFFVSALRKELLFVRPAKLRKEMNKPIKS